ncbi:MAG: D-alanyl-D-alanine carboxypeptidase/D-alanyl-D-alanine-endopeptidase, partial [Actinomycetes bacterium]|nr:D-alanyl-D-alanine carboxypeptidase/D-alanyl-D-alanine-endopeptidase [Actinomycetes bacterium]MDX5451075.1 D-alanyl-D-alanine carboxypeptidase/D-alanyl-D-alanine-endopeptidase [Actinomycetes bacterium]
MKAAGVLAATLLLLAGGYVAADAVDAVPGPLTTRRVIPDPAPYPDPTAVPAVAPTVAGPPAPVPVGDRQGLVDDLA